MVLGLVQRPELNGKLATVSSQGAGADTDARVAATVAAGTTTKLSTTTCSTQLERPFPKWPHECLR